MTKDVVKIAEIRPGKRVIIAKEFHGFRIRVQEHRSIIRQYAKTDADGWRDCLISFAPDFDKAVAQMNYYLRSYGAKEVEPD